MKTKKQKNITGSIVFLAILNISLVAIAFGGSPKITYEGLLSKSSMSPPFTIYSRLKDGTLMKIKDMSYNHLQNSISKFKNRFDVSAFEKEFNNK